jgi:hypothetical protein
MLFALSFPVEAQQTQKVARVGYISGSDAKASLAQVEGFREGLRNLGYHEGKNILIQNRCRFTS